MLLVQKSGVSLYDDKNYGEEVVSVSITVLLIYITLYYSLFLEMRSTGIGVDKAVSTFLFKGEFFCLNQCCIAVHTCGL